MIIIRQFNNLHDMIQSIDHHDHDLFIRLGKHAVSWDLRSYLDECFSHWKCKLSLRISSIRKICIQSSLCFPRCAAASLFFTSLPLSSTEQCCYCSSIIFLPAFFNPISLHSACFKLHCSSFIPCCRLLCALTSSSSPPQASHFI